LQRVLCFSAVDSTVHRQYRRCNETRDNKRDEVLVEEKEAQREIFL
jgi:hypothetical protein